MTRDNVARFDETCEKHVSILRLFHEAGGKYSKDPQLYDILEIRDTNLPRLFEFFAAAEREKLAHWMRSLGYATGQGNSIEDLLDHLGTQIAEGLEAEVLMEREACARVCEAEGARTDASWVGCAAAIRARGNK